MPAAVVAVRRLFGVEHPDAMIVVGTVIFLVLFLASLAFARKLHLFDPVLLHHYDPSTGEDELVAPGDKAFDEEAEKLEEKREERREGLRDAIIGDQDGEKQK